MRQSDLPYQRQLEQRHADEQPVARLPEVCCPRVRVHLRANLRSGASWTYPLNITSWNSQANDFINNVLPTRLQLPLVELRSGAHNVFTVYKIMIGKPSVANASDTSWLGPGLEASALPCEYCKLHVSTTAITAGHNSSQ